ncbi:DUF305 domain-containing protein [Clavibacter tessellarius]|uniref:DUF305 domain-containing protein n=1 Tax=Clavibacter tessellarius TaxID=31965 RepID=UPI00324D3CAA
MHRRPRGRGPGLLTVADRGSDASDPRPEGDAVVDHVPDDDIREEELQGLVAHGEESRARGRRLRIGLAAGIVAVALVVAGLLVGRVTAPVSALTPSTNSAEAGFSRDMQVHHEQAVQMSLMIIDRTDDPEVKLIAQDIAQAQSQQAGQMYAFLTSWGLDQAPSQPRMTWMTLPTLDGKTDHSSMDMTPGATMPGLASQADLEELQGLTGVDAERKFLTLMIAHHRGGVEMAQALLDRSRNPLVTDLANGMVMIQDKEILYMQQLLDARS